jgi:hypothetical protein
MNATLAADPCHEDPGRKRAGQGELLALAIQLADSDASQEEIHASLQAQFPGLHPDNHYQNPAAEAVMRRIVRERARLLSRQIDIRRLRAKGLPESLADRHVPAAGPAQTAPIVTAPGEYE